jgi:hypothetical protein
MGILHHRVSREEGRLVELPLWALSAGASGWITDLEAYETCRVVGVVKRLTIDTVQGSIEATVTDGTGWVVARWSTRRPTPQLGVVPGRGVLLEGVPIAGEDGLVLVDPRFHIVSLSADA